MNANTLPGQNQAYQDTQSLSAITFEGSSKNFKPVMIFEYYATLRIVEKERAMATTEAQHKHYVRWLASFVMDEDKYIDINRLVDEKPQENLNRLVKKKKELLGKADFCETDLSPEERVHCCSDACDEAIYEIQRYMDSALGMVKERGIGVAFPFAAGGRFNFPMNTVPPDGQYQNLKTKRIYELRLWSTLMRTRAGAIVEDEQPDDVDRGDADAVES
jgi:hypothetical protein